VEEVRYKLWPTRGKRKRGPGVTLSGRAFKT
jgi:hypothetical protein